ncbi:Hypothetical_protein [Hexamita inflata]|uniref:Hypothetical_protein n=1 Tax=Hexamita inflata TaxID=28002 RepID=A0ABP1GXD2_9EUKA
MLVKNSNSLRELVIQSQLAHQHVLSSSLRIFDDFCPNKRLTANKSAIYRTAIQIQDIDLGKSHEQELLQIQQKKHDMLQKRKEIARQFTKTNTTQKNYLDPTHKNAFQLKALQNDSYSFRLDSNNEMILTNQIQSVELVQEELNPLQRLESRGSFTEYEEQSVGILCKIIQKKILVSSLQIKTKQYAKCHKEIMNAINDYEMIHIDIQPGKVFINGENRIFDKIIGLGVVNDIFLVGFVTKNQMDVAAFDQNIQEARELFQKFK